MLGIEGRARFGALHLICVASLVGITHAAGNGYGGISIGVGRWTREPGMSVGRGHSGAVTGSAL